MRSLGVNFRSSLRRTLQVRLHSGAQFPSQSALSYKTPKSEVDMTC